MSFFVKINSFSNLFFYLNRKILPCFKRKQENFVKKNRGFVDLEFIKAYHEDIIEIVKTLPLQAGCLEQNKSL